MAAPVRTLIDVGFELVWQRDRRTPEARVTFTVWEMSLIRDRMISVGASFVEPMGLDVPREMLGARSKTKKKGIPAYKLVSADDWLVRADEIAEALERLRDVGLLTETDEDLWKSWIDYLALARTRGGFRVR